MTRKFSLLTAAALPLIPAALFACGGDDGPKPIVRDSGMGSGSGSGSGSQVVCDAMANYPTATFQMQSARYSNGSAADQPQKSLQWTGQQADMTYLRVILFGNCGSGSGSGGCSGGTPTFPTTFTAPVTMDLATAPDVLFLLLADLNTSTMRFDTLYLATAGTLNITAAANGSGMTFSGNGANVDTTHIEIVNNQITEHPDGCMSSIGSFQWTATTGSNTSATAKPEFIDASSREEALRKYLSNRTY